MFCKWCGNKITNNGVPCPTCGREQDALENGNGFWDLCHVVPNVEQGDVPSTTKEGIGANEERHTQTIRGEYQETKKVPKGRNNRAVALMCVMCLLLAIGLVESTIALAKTSKCMARIASIEVQLSGLRTDVISGMSEIKDYLDTAVKTNSAQTPAETSKTDDNDDWEDILNLESASAIVTGIISVEAHKIKSSRANQVLIVSGNPLVLENAKLVWQQYIDQTQEWVTIAENSECILVNEDDGIDQIRVLCICQNELKEYTIYGAYYAMNTKFEETPDCEEPTDSYQKEHIITETEREDTELPRQGELVEAE